VDVFFAGRACVSFLGSFGFVSNLFVVAVIAVYKPMHKQMTNVYIANQSLIDSTVALFLFFTTMFPDDLHLLTPGNVADEMLCRLWYTKLPLWSMLVSSTYGILTLSFERFLAVVFPIWHKTKFNRRMVF
jgi:7 transmembrane receptor (rhodopsin family)